MVFWRKRFDPFGIFIMGKIWYNIHMNIALLLSGGVDSSVGLKLLTEAGHHVTAFYLKIWLEDELSFLGSCPWEEDLSYARSLCGQLGVPLEIVPLQKEYWEHIVTYTIAEIKKGRTPTPDVFCNTLIKFNAFYTYLSPNFQHVATGHYAQTRYDGHQVDLVCSPDEIKDQTYFLSRLRQEQLRTILFPIGHLKKKEVRDHAKTFDLPSKNRPDSQGICFLGKIKFSEFIRHHLGERVGKLIEWETGTILGEHRGYWFYTIGQRQGLGLGGGPWYVVAKACEDNVVFISRNYYSEDKKRNSFIVEQIHEINKKIPTVCEVKLRHGAVRYPSVIEVRHDGTARVTIKGKDQGIAPGQLAVFYQDDICLGSALIAQSSME